MASSHRDAIPMAWMSSRPSGWLPDGLDELQSHREAIPMAWMSSRAIPTAWSSSRPSESHPDGSGAHPGHQDGFPMALELIQAIGIASQRPGSKYSNWFEYSNQKMAAALFESNRIEFEYSN
ncbi:hypothetical protein H4Q26_003060 [Puccinia striiformis f. sp. tritici PST-130]|nr:hypothetical protein H4Q26_003060 [Puccinia striiformis f. sp. tritici PST-130]